MGIVGQFDHPDMLAATDKILAACQKCNVAAGIHVVKPDTDQALRRIDQGYRLLAYSLDITIIGTQCRSALKMIREELRNDT